MNCRIILFLSLVSCLFIYSGCTTNKTNQDQSNAAQIKSLLPDLQSGFEWVVFKNCAIPVPSVWHQYSKESTFVSSVESVEDERIFETGLTIQFLDDVEKTYKVPASVAALSVYHEMKNDTLNTELNSSYNEKEDGMKIYVFTYENAPEIVKPITIHKAIFANDKTSLMYIFTFESPSETWEHNWSKFGSYMLGQIAIIDSSN